ncbi:MAG: NADH-quinone oxidoreductase subunit A [Bacteriovoracaceae bacterium]|nr:NADH-quinone oxidoreductase subunit A [Bacteriovoracaceae bacterium]
MKFSGFESYMPVVILMGLSLLVGIGGRLASKLLTSKKFEEKKEDAYECGEEAQGSAWSLFNVRFYVVGLIFIIFDVESVLMFPIVAIYKSLVETGKGGFVLIEILLFLFILIAGIAYCWRKGDLGWVKSFQNSSKKNGQRL